MEDKPFLSREESIRIFEKELLPHITALTTFAYHLTLDEADAEDLVQETYLKAFKSIEKYMEGTNAKAWLFKILKNGYINDFRKRTKRPNRVDFEDFVNYHDSDDDNNSGFLDLREELFDQLMGDEVTRAINSLPIDFRTVILLCDIEGFTYEEIAKIIDIPVGTVRSRLHRGRNILKVQLRDYAEKQGFADPRTHVSDPESQDGAGKEELK
ncbi:MAG: sigma-70 family RNA polymerase sigma factor [Saprospiraceae bacterium]